MSNTNEMERQKLTHYLFIYSSGYKREKSTPYKICFRFNKIQKNGRVSLLAILSDPFSLLPWEECT